MNLLGVDDDLARPADCDPVHRSGSEVRNPMHALNPGVAEDRADHHGVKLRADNFQYHEVAHTRSIAERAHRPQGGAEIRPPLGLQGAAEEQSNRDEQHRDQGGETDQHLGRGRDP